MLRDCLRASQLVSFPRRTKSECCSFHFTPFPTYLLVFCLFILIPVAITIMSSSYHRRSCLYLYRAGLLHTTERNKEVEVDREEGVS